MNSDNTLHFFSITFVLLSFVTFSCTSEYDRMVKSELASGVKNDSLFLGLYFGMTKDDFYKHCWDLNKKRLISNGHQGTSVSYDIELNETANSLFFPKFHENKIYEIPLDLQYKSWAPWNMAASSDILIDEVKKWIEKNYGTGFIELDADNPNSKIWVKMDGNRRIIIKKSINTVTVLFSDMSVKMSKKTATAMKQEEC